MGLPWTKHYAGCGKIKGELPTSYPQVVDAGRRTVAPCRALSESCYYHPMITPHPTLDPSTASGKLAGMVRRLIHGAMRSSLRELLEPSFAEVKTSFAEIKTAIVQVNVRLDRIEVRLDAMDARFDRMDSRFDRMDSRFDRMDAKFGSIDAKFGPIDARFDALSSRLDQFGVQQGQLIKEVAALQRDHETTHDMLQRIGRLEDRLLRA